MMQRHWLQADWEVSPKVVAFSTTRVGGASNAPYASCNVALHVGDEPSVVAENRSAVAARLPRDLQWQWLEQVHSTDVAVVERAGPPLEADALLTSRPKIVCCVQTADCLPLLLADVSGTEVAAVHAGWRGLAAGVIEKTVEAMATPADRLAVWLGPAIGSCHFEVGAEVRDSFLSAAEGAQSAASIENAFTPNGRQGKFMADLYQIARAKLTDLGVTAVSGGEHCTYCDKERFYSYRRDGETGRLLHAIYIDA